MSVHSKCCSVFVGNFALKFFFNPEFLKKNDSGPEAVAVIHRKYWFLHQPDSQSALG